jgi:hypothetical protein
MEDIVHISLGTRPKDDPALTRLDCRQPLEISRFQLISVVSLPLDQRPNDDETAPRKPKKIGQNNVLRSVARIVF